MVKAHFIKMASVVMRRWSWWMPTWLFSSSSAQCTSAWMHRSGCGWVWVILTLTLTLWNGKILDCYGFFESLFWKLECLQPLKLRWVQTVLTRRVCNFCLCLKTQVWMFLALGVSSLSSVRWRCKTFSPGVFCWSFGVVAMSLGKIWVHFLLIQDGS